MKKFFGFSVIIYALFAVGSGLWIPQVRLSGDVSADSTLVEVALITQTYSEEDERVWHLVTSFKGYDQGNQYIRTKTFYIPGNRFRIGYMVKPESMENIDSANAASNDTPFFHIQARQVTGNQELLLSGRLEEKFLMPFSDSFEVAIGQSHFCLQIWVVQNRHNVKLSIRRYIVFSS